MVFMWTTFAIAGEPLSSLEADEKAAEAAKEAEEAKAKAKAEGETPPLLPLPSPAPKTKEPAATEPSEESRVEKNVTFVSAGFQTAHLVESPRCTDGACPGLLSLDTAAAWDGQTVERRIDGPDNGWKRKNVKVRKVKP